MVFKIVTCVLINYGEYKMQLMNNSFNMLKLMVQLMYHGDNCKRCQKNH